MKTRERIFALATAVAIAFGPQLAQAACSGDACSFLTYDGTTLTNTDRQNKMVVGVCFIGDNGSCGNPAKIVEYTVEPLGHELVSKRQAVEVRSAKFIGRRWVPGPNKLMDKVFLDKVTVTNGGQVPLKVVILDSGLADIGHTPDHKTGRFDIPLTKGVDKYTWEVFTPGAGAPCQRVRDETKFSITVQCQGAKIPDAAQKPVTMPVSADSGRRWAEKCRAGGAGGPIEACCTRQRTAEPYCMQQPQSSSSSSDCAAAEQLCRTSLKSAVR